MSCYDPSLHTEDTLKEIEGILRNEVASYLKNTSVNLYNRDAITYNVLDTSVKLVDPSKIGFHGASLMYEGVISLEECCSSGKKTLTHNSIIVKRMPNIAFMRVAKNSADQFWNESVMFSDIVPRLIKTCGSSEWVNNDIGAVLRNINEAADLFPKCFYSSPDSENGMIALQDLRPLGYKIGGGDLMLLDYDHIVLSLKGLARFHALSYGMKKKELDSYKNHVMTNPKDTRRFFANETESDISFRKLLRHSVMLIFDKLRNDDLYKEKIEWLRVKCENVSEYFKELLTPEEPLATLCHGDFNMNNLLFKYDSNNKPIGVKILDFQNICYSSPAIDFSTFLVINASADLWSKHLGDFFSVYHVTLINSLSEFLNCSKESLLTEFGMDAFRREFSKKCMYGFLMTAGFIMNFVYSKDKQIAFETFLRAVKNIDDFIKENVEFEDEDAINRLVPLAKELLNNLCVY